MGKHRDFVKAVFSHWNTAMSGIVAALFLGVCDYLYAQWRGSAAMPWYVYGFVAFSFAIYGCYRAWLDKDQALQEALRQLSALTAQLEDEIDETLREVMTGQASGLTPPTKLAYLQRREYYTQLELEKAAAEDKPALINKLMRILKQQIDLGVFQRPSTQAIDQLHAIAKKLKKLRDLAKTLRRDRH